MPTYALLSVYDKTGIVEFAQGLIANGFSLLASGGTAKALLDAGLPVEDVAGLVGGKAILGHRVVTLSRELHAGLLSTDSPEDTKEMESLGLRRIELVCVDLYPLEAEIAKPDSTLASVIEKTDIGGPTMLRAAAKGGRIVIADKSDYARVLKWLVAGEPDGANFRRALAAKAEAVVAHYVLASARYLSERGYEGSMGTRVTTLRYGENQRQTYAALYAMEESVSDPLALSALKLIEGTGPSFINLADAFRLMETGSRIAAGFKQNFGSVPLLAVAVKHGNACGAAVGTDPLEVVRKVVEGDPEAIFGGVVLLNFEVTEELATLLRTHGMPEGRRRMLDSVIAPSFTEGATDELARKKTGKCRMFTNPALAGEGLASIEATPRFRQVRGGFLVQDGDPYVLSLKSEWKKTLTQQQQEDVVLGWGVGSTSNSNTIALIKNGMLIGMGVGQRSRVMAARVAFLYTDTYGHEVQGAVAYSDSFFPFPDGPETLAKRGVSVIFASSGAERDAEVQAVCEKMGVTLLQLPDTEVRGFYGH